MSKWIGLRDSEDYSSIQEVLHCPPTIIHEVLYTMHPFGYRRIVTDVRFVT